MSGFVSAGWSRPIVYEAGRGGADLGILLLPTSISQLIVSTDIAQDDLHISDLCPSAHHPSHPFGPVSSARPLPRLGQYLPIRHPHPPHLPSFTLSLRRLSLTFPDLPQRNYLPPSVPPRSPAAHSAPPPVSLSCPNIPQGADEREYPAGGGAA